VVSRATGLGGAPRGANLVTARRAWQRCPLHQPQLPPQCVHQGRDHGRRQPRGHPRAARARALRRDHVRLQGAPARRSLAASPQRRQLLQLSTHDPAACAARGPDQVHWQAAAQETAQWAASLCRRLPARVVRTPSGTASGRGSCTLSAAAAERLPAVAGRRALSSRDLLVASSTRAAA